MLVNIKHGSNGYCQFVKKTLENQEALFFWQANGLFISEIKFLSERDTDFPALSTCGVLYSCFFLLRYVRVLNIFFSMKHAILCTSSGFGMIRDVYENHPHPKNELSCATLNEHQWSPCGEILPSTVVPMGNVWSTWTSRNIYLRKHETWRFYAPGCNPSKWRFLVPMVYIYINMYTQIYVSLSGCLFQHHLDTRLWKKTWFSVLF